MAKGKRQMTKAGWSTPAGLFFFGLRTSDFGLRTSDVGLRTLLARDVHVDRVAAVGLVKRLQHRVSDLEAQRRRIAGDGFPDVLRVQRDLAPVGPRAGF